MAICPKCGSYAPEGVRNCTVCNASIPQDETHRAAEPREAEETPKGRVYYSPEIQNDAPKVMWYIAMAILFAIPLAGNKICKRNCKRILDGFKTKGG